MSIRSSVRKVLADRGRNDAAQLFLVLRASELRLLPRIGQESALDKDTCAADMLHEIDAAAFLAPAAAAGIQGRNKSGLQLTGKVLAALRPGKEDLCSAVPAVRELILVDAQQQGVSVPLTILTRSFRSEIFFWAMVSPFV